MMKKVIILSMLMWSFCFEVLAGDKEILQQAYQLVVDKHVSRVSLYSVFTSAFSGLSEIDKNIKIVSEANSISVYYNGKLSKVYSVPKNEENAKEWAEFSFYILEELKKISPKLQHKDFELVVLPGVGHTMGESYGEHKRFDFFVRHLMGVNPPKWDEIK